MDRVYVEANGTRLYCETAGSGPALLFLHGFTLDHRMWRAQLEGLSDRFRVVTYDARGFGKSALPTGPYRHYEDAAALCEALALERVVVVGHSIGAHQLLELSLARPDLVAGWVGMCTSSPFIVPFPDEIAQRFAAMRQAVKEGGVPAVKRIWGQASWFRSVHRNPSVAAEFEAMHDDYSGWHWLNDNPAQGLEPPVAAQLGSFTQPALVITGALDAPYNDSVAEKLLASIPRSSALRLPNAGHMANMEEPEAINRALADFAASVH